MSGPSSLWAFTGDWKITREIAHAGGQMDRLTGTCRFTRTGPRLLQDEAGWLETAEGRFQASRRYVWGESNGRIEVSFADMRPFHSIPLGEACPETVHLCPPDRYHVAYDFTGWPAWRTVWTVEGPRKDYVMATRFAPADGAAHLVSAEA